MGCGGLFTLSSSQVSSQGPSHCHISIMNSFVVTSLALLALFSTQVSCASSRVEVSVSVDHNTDGKPQPRFAVTEPAWVTELLGPTEAPSTTKRPSIPDRIRNTVVTGFQQIGNTINEIPVRINQIFQGIQQGATNIIRRPMTTSKPSGAGVPAVANETVVNATASAPSKKQ